MPDPTLKEPYAAVAVPLPLPGPLDYLVPPSLNERVTAGVRVRVPVGRRKVTGVVLERHGRTPERGGSQAPDEGPVAPIKLKPVEAAVDLAPILPSELLELAGFVSEYYLAPIGETLRSLLPSGLEAWGSQRVWLTDRGAMAPVGEGAGEARESGGEGSLEVESRILETLRPGGRMSLAELESASGSEGFHQAIEALRRRGWLSVSEPRAAGSRYVTALELAPGSPEELLERCGRSKPARAVVEWLAAAGRPALRSELEGELEISPGVVRRLIKLGVLRTFTQMARLDLGEHRADTGSHGERPRIVLRPDQKTAADQLRQGLRAGGFRPFLLHGMTGSGKTEVYLRAVESVLSGTGSAILLVPEIALVPALAGTLRRRFGRSAAILHSALSSPERHQEWQRIRNGEARLVLGPRSAILAPVKELRLVVVDEEHDPAYKQGSTPRYNARDVALWRGREAGATVALVSATPSLESRLNVVRERLAPLVLTERVGVGKLPESLLVDLRESGSRRLPGTIDFSPRLLAEMEEAFAAGDQVILLRNRRGYSPVLLCRACGEDLRCEDCGLPRTFHKGFNEMRCHYCGSRRAVPEDCPACGESALEPVGTGTERVEEDFRERFPEVPVAVLDRDTVRRRGGVAAVLDRFGRGETRALIGTQMVAKGHHFPGVALAAVLQADAYLSFPDFRAVERTYNLLIQLGGRAGRGERAGKFLIQTYHPDHYAIRAALSQDDRAFAEEEMRFRQVFHYPPYTRMVQLMIQDKKRERAGATAERLAHDLGRRAGQGIRIMGPAPAAFERLRGKWRFQILVRGRSGRQVRDLVRSAMPDRSGSEIIVDVDPLELL